MVGGSACTAAGLKEGSLAWPELLERQIDSISVKTHSRGGLTFVQSISLLTELSKCDVLILHFGTSVGWPRIVTKFQDRFGIKFSSEYGFQMPYQIPGKPFNVRFKKLLKMRIKNFIKYLFALLGFYQPKTSLHEIDDQIEIIHSLASKKADQILWIQHRGLTAPRTLIERFFYNKFYKKVLQALQPYHSESFVVLDFPDYLDNHRFYLDDLVHFSQDGHLEMCELVVNQLRTLKKGI